MKKLLLVLVLVAPSVAVSAQQADPVFLQRALTVMQSQRDQAMNALVMVEVNVVELKDELAKTKARMKELEPKLEEKK